MKKNFKKNWKAVLAIIIIVFLAQKIYANFFKAVDEVVLVEKDFVELYAIGSEKTGMLESFCSVEASDDAALVAETGGKVREVYVSEGAIVEKGQKIFSLDNIPQRVAVENAKVSLTSAKLALADLLKKNDSSSSSSILKQTQQQQENLVTNARNTYLNNDLRAYPEDFDEESPAPIISGNYTCDTEGVYTIDVYASAAESGASMRITGLEDARSSASISYPTPLGDCGLEIVFPEDFRKNKVWTVAIPNTRSSSHFQAKKAYETAVSGKDIVLNNTQASPEQIARERARVSQAQLQLQSAYETLSKATVVAPVAGTLSEFDVQVGDFISAFSEAGRVKSVQQLELVSYINVDEKDYIVAGATAVIEGLETTVSRVSPTVNNTKKIKVVMDAPEKNTLTEGAQYACQIERQSDTTESNEDGGLIIPLSAISIIGQDPYVFALEKNQEGTDMAVKQKVETGSLLGSGVKIYGLDESVANIIYDARGIRDQQLILVK